MRRPIHRLLIYCALGTWAWTSGCAPPEGEDPLPSWADTEARTRIVEFVTSVTDPGQSGLFVEPSDRIAVFDNDGTLWSEQPAYFQLLFAMDRVKSLAAADSTLLESEALEAAATNDLPTLMSLGMAGLGEVIDASHAGVSVDRFQTDVARWLDTATHPGSGQPYTAMVFQPMLELLAYLRANDFRTYIVSGGGTDFIRTFADEVYGVPPEQVVGSEGETRYALSDGGPSILKEEGISFIDDGPGKPVGIERRIGRRPIMAVGNSDGDFEMLEWTTAGEGPRLGVLVHHTDPDREFAYDRGSPFGSLARGLDESAARGWLVVDMARDWLRVYPDEP
jgi:hypothetical protein